MEAGFFNDFDMKIVQAIQFMQSMCFGRHTCAVFIILLADCG